MTKLSYGFLIASLIIILTRCSNMAAESNDELIGKWNGKWLMDSLNFDSDRDGISFTMNGSIEFISQNEVAISLYGYSGCIFSQDTIVNTLVWKKNEDTLTLYNKGDNNRIFYKIIELNESLMKLRLVDDIHITLIKEKK